MNNQQIQEQLIKHRLLDPPADGAWGKQSIAALSYFQELAGLPKGDINAATITALEKTEIIPIKLGQDFASRVIRYMIEADYWVPVGEKRYTIAYVEGVDADGSINNDNPNEWNDRRLIIEIPNGIPRLVSNWSATTEPGDYWVKHPMNPSGCARIHFGQYKAWSVGMHGSRPYEALVQVNPIHVTRDKNKDNIRTGDNVAIGLFGINQHHGYNCPVVDQNSAGCLVGQSVQGHQDFMKLVKSDHRYRLNSSYIFYTAVIAGDKLAPIKKSKLPPIAWHNIKS